MLWFRMGLVAFGISWPFLLRPWRSPLLQWRIETYGIVDEQGRLLHAEAITFLRMVRFAIAHRRELVRFLRWAARL